jgi:DNA-binding transcriptional LysR family regulator
MDIRQLKSLLAIAETGSFSLAADQVHLTVSAVSQQMRALETELGTTLFDRSRRPPRLTVAGQQLLEAAGDLVRTAERAVDMISGRGVSGTLTLGTVRSSALSVLPRAIVQMRAEYPDLRIKLRVGNSDVLMQDVDAGRIDAAMVAEHHLPPSLRWRVFLNEPLFVVAPPGTPPGTAEELLTRLPFVRFRVNVPLARLIDQELARLNLPLNEAAEIDTIASITAMVANGFGVSVVPQVAIRDCAVQMVTAPFGAPQIHRQIGIVERPGAARSALIGRLHDLLLRASAT